MQKHHILFKKEIVNFFLNIDNKSTIYAIGEISGSSKESRYLFIKTFRKLKLVTTKPLKLTKKGESLKKELQRICDLLPNDDK